MAEIKVPKPPKSAFNPNRPASDLLKHQVNHLEWAVRHAGERRAGYTVKPVKTERDAAARVASLIPRLASAAKLPFVTSEIPDDQAVNHPARKTARKTARKIARKTKRTAKTKPAVTRRSRARAKR